MSFLFSHSNSKHSPLLYVLWFQTFPADLDPGSQHTDLGAAVWTFLLRSPRCTWRPGSHLGVTWEPTGGPLALAPLLNTGQYGPGSLGELPQAAGQKMAAARPLSPQCAVRQGLATA